MIFVPFKAEDMLLVADVHGNVADEQAGMDLVELGKRSLSRGPCLTLIDVLDEEMGEKPIACGGLAFIFKETAEIWLRLSLQGRGPHAVKALKEQMYRWIEEYHLDRLQATAQARWREDCHFLSWLGMECEGLMRRYGPGGLDQMRYAWVRS